MSNEIKNVKYSLCLGHSAFNFMLKITAGKFRKSVGLHIPAQGGNMVIHPNEKESGHSAYESNEETHVKNLSPAHLVTKLHPAGCLKMKRLFLKVNHRNIKAEF